MRAEYGLSHAYMISLWRSGRNGRLTGAGRLCQREITHQVYCEPLPLFRASTVGLPSRSARFITSSRSTSRGRQAEKAQKYPLRLYQPTMSQQSTSCWIRRCKRQYIFLQQFTLVSRWRARDINSSRRLVSELHLRSPRPQSPRCLSSGWTRATGGRWLPQFSREKGHMRAELSQREKLTMRALIPSRTECTCSSPKHITHKSGVRKRWHGSTHLLKRFSTDIISHTSETKSPEDKKRMTGSTGALLCPRTLICLRHRLPLANVKCIVCFYSCFRDRSRWRRSHSAL